LRGESSIELAKKLLNNEPVPPAEYIEHVFINTQIINNYNET